MLAPDIVSILRCPVTGTDLSPASAPLLAHVNTLVAAGKLSSRLGEPRQSPLETALINADGSLLYPIDGGILNLLATDALVVPEDLRPAPA